MTHNTLTVNGMDFSVPSVCVWFIPHVCHLLTEFIWMTGRGGRNVNGHTDGEMERQTEWREKGVITD